MKSKIAQESEKAKKGKEIYVAMGYERSLRAVAEALKISTVTVAIWSSCFKWQEFAKAHDDKVHADTLERISKRQSEIKAQMVQLVEKAFHDIAEFNKDGSIKRIKYNIRVRNISDLERLIKLYMLVIGEPTERGETTHKHEFDLRTISTESLRNIASRSSIGTIAQGTA